MKPIIIMGRGWKIPAVIGARATGACMEASYLTTDTVYISCNEPATRRVFDGRANRAYDMCAAHAEHNIRRGMKASV